MARSEFRIIANQLIEKLRPTNVVDKHIVRGIPNSYTLRSPHTMSLSGQIVLDIGAQIGGFSCMALMQGAKAVVAVEPVARNVKLLKQKLKDRRLKVYHCACVGTIVKGRRYTVVSSPKNKSRANFGHSMLSVNSKALVRKDQLEEHCSVVSISHLLSKYRPSIMKIDCEGSEHEILSAAKLNKQLAAIFMEVHFFRKEYRHSFPTLLLKLRKQGFSIVRGRRSIINATGRYGVIHLVRKAKWIK